ncbi:hypothetical protein ACIQZN_08610 [Streptomyces sp. NPDC097595]|uniref:hypothetical protein n=1 Tax=Streptomyces sp. NPDC097595 TaxID=3366090 RepID=UPI0038243BE7
MNARTSRVVATAGLLLLSGAGVLATAGQSAAATRDGSTNSGEFGAYYLQNQASYVFDFASYDANFANDSFPKASGINPDDNTESYWNRNSTYVDVYTESGRGGVHGWIPDGLSGDFSSNYKNNVTSAYER